MADIRPLTARHDRRTCPTLSIVFSFWNEAAVIPELVTRCRRVLDAEVAAGHIEHYEFVFVNDASSDDSEAILRRFGQERGDIRIVTMSRKFGVTPCVLAGMERATGDVVVYMDADLQDPPEVIPQLLEAYRNDPEVEVVHTVRTKRDGETWIKLFITQIGYRILRATSTVELQIEAGDFKLLSRRAVEWVTKFREKRPYMRGIVAWIGFKQTSVRYHREERFSGETKFPVFSRKVISNFVNSALISFSDIPLKLTILAGALCWLATLIYITWVIILYLLGYHPAWSIMMVVLLLVGGANMLGIGMVGLYVGAIFSESKMRPNYIVKDEFGFPDDASEPTS